MGFTMQSYNLQELDAHKTSAIQSIWIKELEQNSDSLIQLSSSLFENILSQKNYGVLTKRHNKDTYMAVVNSDTGETDAIVCIVFSKLGSSSMCKIMDIYHAPHISNLADEMYNKKYYEIFLSVLANMLQITKTSKYSVTKIYARDDISQKTIQAIDSDSNKSLLKDVGFEMNLLGRQWLEFKTI